MADSDKPWIIHEGNIILNHDEFLLDADEGVWRVGKVIFFGENRDTRATDCALETIAEHYDDFPDSLLKRRIIPDKEVEKGLLEAREAFARERGVDDSDAAALEAIDGFWLYLDEYNWTWEMTNGGTYWNKEHGPLHPEPVYPGSALWNDVLRGCIQHDSAEAARCFADQLEWGLGWAGTPMAYLLAAHAPRLLVKTLDDAGFETKTFGAWYAFYSDDFPGDALPLLFVNDASGLIVSRADQETFKQLEELTRVLDKAAE